MMIVPDQSTMNAITVIHLIITGVIAVAVFRENRRLRQTDKEMELELEEYKQEKAQRQLKNIPQPKIRFTEDMNHPFVLDIPKKAAELQDEVVERGIKIKHTRNYLGKKDQ